MSSAAGTERSVLEQLIELYRDEPWVSLLTTFIVAGTASVFLFFVIRAISRAGKVNPPRVVLSLLIALLGLVALIGVIIRPDVDALAVATGTAVGALAGALATAFQGEEEPCGQVADGDDGGDGDDEDGGGPGT